MIRGTVAVRRHPAGDFRLIRLRRVGEYPTRHAPARGAADLRAHSAWPPPCLGSVCMHQDQKKEKQQQRATCMTKYAVWSASARRAASAGRALRRASPHDTRLKAWRSSLLSGAWRPVVHFFKALYASACVPACLAVRFWTLADPSLGGMCSKHSKY